METRVAVIAIIVEDSGEVESLNTILHEYAEYVFGIMCGIIFYMFPRTLKQSKKNSARRNRIGFNSCGL